MIPKTFRKELVLKPGEIITVFEEAFKDDFFAIDEIYTVWQPGIEIYFYFDGSLFDIFESKIIKPDAQGYYKYSRSFLKYPLIITNDMLVVAKNTSNEEKQVVVVIDGYLAPKSKFKIRPLV